MGLLVIAALTSALCALCLLTSIVRLFQGHGPLSYALSFILCLPLTFFAIYQVTGFNIGFAQDTGGGWVTVISFIKCLTSAILGAIFFAVGETRREKP